MENLKSLLPILGLISLLLASSGGLAQAPPPLTSVCKDAAGSVLEGDCPPIGISINHANAKVLETLSGVGPKLAQAIIAYRDKHGPFQSLDDLKQVRGIGASLLEKNQHLLILD